MARRKSGFMDAAEWKAGNRRMLGLPANATSKQVGDAAMAQLTATYLARFGGKAKRKPAEARFIKAGLTTAQRKKAQKKAIFEGQGGRGTNRNSWTGGGG